MVSAALEAHQRHRRRTVAFSIIKVLNELMSAFSPQTTKTGNLPHLSYVLRKPEPLGTELKCVLCYCLMVFLFFDICRGKSNQSGESKKYTNVTKMKTAQVSLTLMEKSKVDRLVTGNGVNP